jgi:hypothetical protein
MNGGKVFCELTFTYGGKSGGEIALTALAETFPMFIQVFVH